MTTFNEIVIEIDKPANSDVPTCKYCWETQKEITDPFLTPCKCTNPICLSCLKRRIKLMNPTTCEICQEEYVIGMELGIEIPPANMLQNSQPTSNVVPQNRILIYHSEENHVCNSRMATCICLIMITTISLTSLYLIGKIV